MAEKIIRFLTFFCLVGMIGSIVIVFYGSKCGDINLVGYGAIASLTLLPLTALFCCLSLIYENNE